MAAWPGPGARAYASQFQSYFGSIAGFGIFWGFGKEEVLGKTLAQVHSISMIYICRLHFGWCFMGKCGQIDHIYVFLMFG